MPRKSKDKRIKDEKKRLEIQFAEVDERKRNLARRLIDEAAYMKATMEDLKVELDENGFVDEMPQGSYSILRESPYAKQYETLIQRYTVIMSKLSDMLPKAEPIKEADDGFDEFVETRD